MKYRKLFKILMIIFWVLTARQLLPVEPMPIADYVWPLIIAGLFTCLYWVEKKVKEKSDKK